ncbi:hypothetical protein [Pontivivens ytuae]|uniref:DUF4124 domain-containing protein n=1 Tax=Pontivivens ytuae TaxID=2789856 RepID=A0A7S9LQV6_9RHOB|nr:hypothetical protein [Pontivivens ytuae]QPH53619.1 hypothetical protein I0K15_17840 [Pontivivens ytuae]
MRHAIPPLVAVALLAACASEPIVECGDATGRVGYIDTDEPCAGIVDVPELAVIGDDTVVAAARPVNLPRYSTVTIGSDNAQQSRALEREIGRVRQDISRDRFELSRLPERATQNRSAREIQSDIDRSRGNLAVLRAERHRLRLQP